jgi:GT2 family glycosyltransferase
LSAREVTQDVAPGRVLIVIVNYKTARLTGNCLRSLEPERRDLPGLRVAVVENASGDAEALAAIIREHGWQDWVGLDVADRNGGFAYGNNRAIRAALESGDPPDYILLLNADTEVFAGAVRALRDFLDSHPDVGIAGSSFANLDGTDWPIAFRFLSVASELEQGLRLGFISKLLRRHLVPVEMEKKEARTDWVSGACIMIRRQVFEAIGLMDEGYFLYFEETDFCLRAARAGWPCWYVPQSRVMHIAGQSTGVTERDAHARRMPPYWFESRRRYFLKNHGLAKALAADLAFGTGYALWRLRRLIQRKPDKDPPCLLQDFWKASVLFRRNRSIRI